jgi:hypothetical protein
MNTREANEYIESLIQGKVQPESEFEAGALNYLRKTVSEEREMKERADYFATELDEMRKKLQALTGRREAYLQILIDAEMKRKAKAGVTNRKILSQEEVQELKLATSSEVIPGNFQKKGELENAQERR